ncbi:VOC family protein [Nocardioides pocheonensis]|uniref:VOC family protein n=1 Tax=Nocardioides pocheonensis TaxID=661485 RepID=A0A3N0GJ63_9ACTN|nr:VOC family protein [Nocardioides pocheonensis]RNM12517.1 VOC family protein [Nocardioides pocheonensis]
MYLENVVFDAREPQRLGRFWEEALGCEPLTDEPEGYETRLTVGDGPVLDLCFQRVPDPATAAHRLRLELGDGGGEADRLLGLGARRRDAGAEPESAELLDDPEGNPFGRGDDAAYDGTGPLVALALDSADPERDAEFWAWLTGWTVTGRGATATLRHPSLRGPVLELRRQSAPKSAAKNRIHLDVRLEAGEDADTVEAAIAEHGGAREHHPEWGELPWRSYTDPSGNDFCVLPPPREA